MTVALQFLPLKVVNRNASENLIIIIEDDHAYL